MKAKMQMPKTKKELANLIATSGRRKTAVARIFLYQEKGEFTVNDQPINDYFPTEKEKLKWMKPFHLVGVSHPTTQFRATIKVEGSGKTSQLGAILLALSKALGKINGDYNSLLKKQGLMTRDPRMVERKKYWYRKARKTPQYSKR